MYLIPWQLPSQTYAAGSRTIQTLKELPKRIQDKHCHLVKLQFDISPFTPTFGSNAVPTLNANQLFNLTFNDGNGVTRFNGDLNVMRAKERLATGRERLPAADEGATTVARYWTRTLHLGPPQMVNYPSDFALHTGVLENASLVFDHRSLAGIDADLSALTAGWRVIAWLMLLDEMRIPPAYQFVQEDTATKDHRLVGRRAYESIALLNDSAFGAISANDFGAFRVDMGRGDIIPTVDAEALRNGFLDDFAVGSFDGVVGEPEAATVDDNSKRVDRTAGSETALTGNSFDLQPVLWTRPGGKLTKLMQAESLCKVSWNGSQSGASVLAGSFLEQTPNIIASLAAKAATAMGVKVTGNPTPKTHSRKPLNVRGSGGKALAFMPWKVVTSG